MTKLLSILLLFDKLFFSVYCTFVMWKISFLNTNLPPPFYSLVFLIFHIFGMYCILRFSVTVMFFIIDE